MAHATTDIVEHLTAMNAIQVAAAVGVLSVLYTLFASPLKHIPGPFFAKFSNLWRLLSVLTRHAEKQQRQMHDRLGPAVRLGPNMVSISDPGMINDIYSRKNVLQKVSSCTQPPDTTTHARRATFTPSMTLTSTAAASPISSPLGMST